MRQVSIDDKYALDTTHAYITGIEALVRLPILQHQRDLERGLNTAGFILIAHGAQRQSSARPVKELS